MLCVTNKPIMLSVVILKVVIVRVVVPQIEVKKTPLDLNRIGRIWSFLNILYF
jgi:hypothetical protein